MHQLFHSLFRGMRSPKFFAVILGLFMLQAVLFAAIVSPSTIEEHSGGYTTRGGGVVPDGNRHIGAIYYFAQQPLLDGPIITDMKNHELWMGDLERFPSYLYYYLLSLPVRTALALGANDTFIIMLIRVIGIGFGVVALWALRKIALELKFGSLVAHLATLALAVTGSFVWLAPAENYDVFSFMLWLLFLLASVQLFMRRDARYLYWMAVWFFLVSIAKYTYIPFAGLAGLVAFGLYARETGYKNLRSTIQKQWRQWRKELSRYAVAGLAVLLVTAGVLFVERIGGNLLFYRSFSPSCTQVHSFDTCMNFGVFERNYTRANEYDAQLESGQAQPIGYNPISYTQFWLDRYYSSMYGYVGHIWIYEFWSLMYIGMTIFVAIIIALAVYMKRRRQKLIRTVGEKYLVGVIVLLVVAQYVFNLRTFITFGGEMYAYAHQGRYLISAIGLVYILLAVMAVRAVRLMSNSTRKWVLPVLLLVCAVALLTNGALMSFFVHANTPDWYSDFGKSIVQLLGII